MEKGFMIKMAFAFTQLAGFGIILGLQVWLGQGVSNINEWIRIIWCLLFSVVIVISLWVKKIREWIPYLEDHWKLGITVAIMSSLVFNSSLVDGRSIVAFILLGISFAYIISTCMIPETRPDWSEKHGSDVIIRADSEKAPSTLEIQKFNQSQTKYMNMEEYTQSNNNNNEMIYIEQSAIKDNTMNHGDNNSFNL